MLLRDQVERLTRSAAWLRKILDAKKSAAAPSATSLTPARKLMPIAEVVARAGREPSSAD